METPNFFPLETLNLLDSILLTGSWKTDLTDPTGSIAHTCTPSPWLYICLLPVTKMLVSHLSAGHLLSNCTPEGLGHRGHVRETSGTF